MSELLPDDQNANKGTERGREALEASLRKYGFGRSILLDKQGRIIAGNKTHEIAGEIGLEDVLIVQVDGRQVVAVQRTDLDLDDPVARELAIADNRVGELDLLWDADVLQRLSELDDVDITAFWNQEELDALISGMGNEEEESAEQNEDEGATGPNQVIPRDGVELGSIWQLGRHRIMCGDCTIDANIKELLKNNFNNVTMVWSDPPYGIKIQHKDGRVGNGNKNAFNKGKAVDAKQYPIIANDDTPELAALSFKALSSLFPKAAHIWWGANNYPWVLPQSTCWIVWDKKTEAGDIDGIDFADAELAYTNAKTAVRVFRHLWLGMWKASENNEARVHPTQKPIALCEWAFDKYGSASDVILDPFLGSAPSIIAAQKMEGDRTVYGFELMPEYIEVILQRWEKFVGTPAKRIN